MGRKSDTKLTGKYVKDLQIPSDSDRIVVFDSAVRGFAVSKYRTGKVSFFIEAKGIDGNVTRRNIKTFIHFSELTSVSEIRNTAERLILTLKSMLSSTYEEGVV